MGRWWTPAPLLWAKLSVSFQHLRPGRQRCWGPAHPATLWSGGAPLALARPPGPRAAENRFPEPRDERPQPRDLEDVMRSQGWDPGQPGSHRPKGAKFFSLSSGGHQRSMSLCWLGGAGGGSGEGRHSLGAALRPGGVAGSVWEVIPKCGSMELAPAGWGAQPPAGGVGTS